jgi:serine protease Do
MRMTTALLFLAFAPSVFGQSAPPGAFAKPVPETVQDLQAIEAHVQKLVERVTPATVCLRLGSVQGSGVIVDRDGHILTAGHVSGAADQDVTIILPDGRRLRGRTLGADNGIDSGMALITDKADFPCVEMAKSADLKKGDWCLALGHPGGFKAGRPPVVRLGRLQDVSVKALISDCALVGGDSGGPLFDMNGRVIGIHSKIAGKVTANIHVPIDTYHDHWLRLAAGEVWGSPLAFLDKFLPGEPYLGMRVALDRKILKIESVTPNSPADQAGLKANDVILKFENQTPAHPDDIGAVLRTRRPGARISVQVQRGNDTMTVTVVLGKRAR